MLSMERCNAISPKPNWFWDIFTFFICQSSYTSILTIKKETSTNKKLRMSLECQPEPRITFASLCMDLWFYGFLLFYNSMSSWNPFSSGTAIWCTKKFTRKEFFFNLQLQSPSCHWDMICCRKNKAEKQQRSGMWLYTCRACL